MNSKDTSPTLISCKKLKPEYGYLQRITIISDFFSIGRGRGLQHSLVIPYLSISRNHCTFKKYHNMWSIQDLSTSGIKVNGRFLGKGYSKILSNGDIIKFEPTEEFVYKWVDPVEVVLEIRRKKKKLDINFINENLLSTVEMRFEESQSYEIQQIEEKIQNIKQMQTAVMVLKQQLQNDTNRKLQQIESEYAAQTENLKGENHEVERQKALLIDERDAELTTVKQKIEPKISCLTVQIQKLNESEEELLKEINIRTKEKLNEEKEQFLTKLSPGIPCKQNMLRKLEKRIKAQKDLQLKLRQEYLEMLQRVAVKIRRAKEMELHEIKELKESEQKSRSGAKNNNSRRSSTRVQEKINYITNLNSCQLLGNWLIEQLKYLKSLNDKINASFNQQYTLLCQLDREKAEIQKKLIETQRNYIVPYTLRNRKTRLQGTKRKSDPVPFVPRRIQKQAEKSSELIGKLEKELKEQENARTLAQTERKEILDIFGVLTVLSEVRAVIESELQCSICTELFVTPFTLNCGHTFCNYCISKWQKRNNTCPICRTAITSEIGCTILNLVIMKMVQNFNDDMKAKRNEIIENRKELETKLLQQPENDTESFSSSFEGDSFAAIELINNDDLSDGSLHSFSIDSSEEPDGSSEDVGEFDNLNFLRDDLDLETLEDYLRTFVMFMRGIRGVVLFSS